MTSIAILGASGHGKVVADTALELGFNNIVFYDDFCAKNSYISSFQIKGNTENLITNVNLYDAVIVAIGDGKMRQKKLDLLEFGGATLVNLIHPQAILSRSVKNKFGTVVFAGAVINADSSIGKGVIVNTGATIDHDCLIGDNVHIAPGSHLSGNVIIGDRSWIGIGASVKQGIQIGSDAMIGAGSVVINDVPDGVTVVGNPARTLVTKNLSI